MTQRPQDERPRWQKIETAPKGQVALFWVVSKSPEESYVDTSGNPIFGEHEPEIRCCKYGQWSSLSKATHWMPLPPAPQEGDEG